MRSRVALRAPSVAVAVAGTLLLSGCMGNTKSTEALIAEASGGAAPAAAAAETVSGAMDAGAVPAADAASVGTTAAAAPKAAGAGAAGGAGTLGGGVPAAQGSGAAAAGRKAAAPSTSAGPAVKASCVGPKSTIVIGGVGQITGVIGTLFSAGAQAMQAWVSSVNASGGLGCHPVRYISADDGGDPSRHLSLVRKLVEQDKVVAMVYQPALITGQASRDYIIEKKIPTFGQEGGQMHWFDSPIFFDNATAGRAFVDFTLLAGARTALPEDKKRLGILTCQEVVFCTVGDTRWKELGAKLGFEPVYNGKASLLNVDFTSQCLAAKDAGVQVLGIAFDASAIERLAQSCKAVNFKPIMFFASVAGAPRFVDNPDMEGFVLAQPVRPWFLTDNPAIQEYQATLRKYVPGLPFDASSVNGWASGKLFELAAEAFKADTVTPQGVLQAMGKVRNNDLGGLSHPLNFFPDKPQPYKACGWVVRIQSGRYVSDGKMTCL